MSLSKNFVSFSHFFTNKKRKLYKLLWNFFLFHLPTAAMILVKLLLSIVKCTFRRLFVQLNDPLFTRHLNNFLIRRFFWLFKESKRTHEYLWKMRLWRTYAQSVRAWELTRVSRFKKKKSKLVTDRLMTLKNKKKGCTRNQRSQIVSLFFVAFYYGSKTSQTVC